MNKVLLLALGAASLSLASCGSSDTTEATTTTEISSAADSTGMEGDASIPDSNTSPESAGATTSGAAPTDTITTR